MELTQSVLLAVVIVLTIFLVVLGFQIFYVLRDLRKTLGRLNRLFDDADSLVEIPYTIINIGSCSVYAIT